MLHTPGNNLHLGKMTPTPTGRVIVFYNIYQDGACALCPCTLVLLDVVCDSWTFKDEKEETNIYESLSLEGENKEGNGR